MKHNDSGIDFGLIASARAGDKESQSLLLKQAELRVYIYILRITMNQQISEDLCQETLLELVKSLPGLTFTHVNYFWAWLYRTSLSKIQKHYRLRGNKRLKFTFIGDKDYLLEGHGQIPPASDQLMRHELCRAVINVMTQLKMHYRCILTLRCLENMSFAEIAAVMEISTAQARLRFFRAKQSLRSKLAKQGLTKDFILPALGAFACLTTSESQKVSAATALTAESLKIGWTTVCLGTLTSSAVIWSLGLLLAVTLLVSHLVSDPSTPGSKEMSPVLDQSLMRIYDEIAYNIPQREYAQLLQIHSTNHPVNEGWKHFVFWPRLESARLLKSPIDNTPASLFVLGQDRWIEYEVPQEIQDREGPEIALSMMSWGALPHVYVTDGLQQRQEIFATSCSSIYTPGKYIVLGFDLSPLDIPFTIRGIRIQGNNNDGPYGGCGIDDPAVYPGPADSVFSR